MVLATIVALLEGSEEERRALREGRRTYYLESVAAAAYRISRQHASASKQEFERSHKGQDWEEVRSDGSLS